jgi:hypothetical protein
MFFPFYAAAGLLHPAPAIFLNHLLPILLINHQHRFGQGKFICKPTRSAVDETPANRTP